jgi:S1-C subfamily serine protease
MSAGPVSLLCSSRLALTVLLMASPLRAQHSWTAQIEDYKPMVVNIETSSEVVFETESKGTGFATGFVVDAERGIIATNRHVTGSGPSYVKINFFDGSFTEAKELYYDPTHDFGFYKIDPAETDFALRAAKLGSWRQLQLGDEILLLGNNDKEEYSIKFGRVANLNVNKGDRHSSYIHTTFDRTGGSSGSPVWNTAGEVIAIHARGSDTSSFELPIDYLVEALRRLQAGESLQRGEIGIDAELISIGEAIKHFGLPSHCHQEIGQNPAGPPKVVQIDSIIPRSNAVGILRASDILYRVEGKLLRDDLYELDALLNQRVGSSVDLQVCRNGEFLDLSVPVDNLENHKIQRFALLAGSVFHDITPRLRRMLFFEGDGVFLSFADPGSSFSRAGQVSRQGNAKVVVQELNGHPVRNLEDLVQAARELQDGHHTYLVVRDFNLFDSSPTPKSITVNLQFGPLKVFSWNPQLLEWRPETETASPPERQP